MKKMKNKIKELFANATRSIVTSLMGTIIGFPQLLEGLQTDNPKTIVVKETFDDSDFSLSGNTLTITVHGLLTDLKDIEGTPYEPVLVIRHDSTRTATSGLRPIVYTKEKVYKDKEITGNRIELPYNKI